MIESADNESFSSSDDEYEHYPTNQTSAVGISVLKYLPEALKIL